jgi:hypothetical protein
MSDGKSTCNPPAGIHEKTKVANVRPGNPIQNPLTPSTQK